MHSRLPLSLMSLLDLFMFQILTQVSSQKVLSRRLGVIHYTEESPRRLSRRPWQTSLRRSSHKTTQRPHCFLLQSSPPIIPASSPLRCLVISLLGLLNFSLARSVSHEPRHKCIWLPRP
ncbi:hypothetical protein IWZ00DRAFT_173511 [Phyllosticta capitalensis]|uniref:Secreted protein n=1 Tax=Phyllosticta capitalensis TaxID=121624 RepID=A0ABR1YYB7_9PEZI